MLTLLLVLLHANTEALAVLLDRSMRTIGGAMKGVQIRANTEFELFSFAPGEAGVITEQWFVALGGANVYTPSSDPIIRVYYDGPAAPPSIEYRLNMGHGLSPFGCSDYAGQLNCSDPALHFSVPSDTSGNHFANVNGGGWGSELLGHGSVRGALKNTYRVPFGAEHGIRITMEQPFLGMVYFYCRGMTNYPTIVGDVQLPPGARLQLHKNEAVEVQPHGFYTLVPQQNASGGMLLQVTLAATSTFIGFMEGCVRAYIDNNTEPIHLSSGTEDYFGSAYFFDSGIFKSPNAGVTWVQGTNPGPYSMTAYKHHVRDPIVWWDKFLLTGRNYDTDGVQCGGAALRDSKAAAAAAAKAAGTKNAKGVDATDLAVATMSTYAWYYVW